MPAIRPSAQQLPEACAAAVVREGERSGVRTRELDAGRPRRDVRRWAPRWR